MLLVVRLSVRLNLVNPYKNGLNNRKENIWFPENKLSLTQARDELFRVLRLWDRIWEINSELT